MGPKVIVATKRNGNKAALEVSETVTLTFEKGDTGVHVNVNDSIPFNSARYFFAKTEYTSVEIVDKNTGDILQSLFL